MVNKADWRRSIGITVMLLFLSALHGYYAPTYPYEHYAQAPQRKNDIRIPMVATPMIDLRVSNGSSARTRSAQLGTR